MSQNPKQKYTKVELLELATKYLVVNKQVAPLAETKTMTRRVIKLNIPNETVKSIKESSKKEEWTVLDNDNWGFNIKAPFKVDDIFWLREPARIEGFERGVIQYSYPSDNTKCYITLPHRYTKQNIPKWIRECQGVPNGCIKEMARFFYRVTSVRVERLQDISDKDIVKEGIYKKNNEYTDPISKIALPTPKSAFSMLWNSTAKAPYRWEDKSVYVWVIEYERLEYVK